MNPRSGDMKKTHWRTEVGVIPHDWQCERVAEAAARSANAIVGGPFGSDLVAADYVSIGVPVIRGQNMSSSTTSGDFAFVSVAKAKSLKANLAYPGDLVFTQRGTLGQVAIVPSDRFRCYLISQSQMKVTLNHTKHDPGYVHQYFSSRAGQRQIIASAIQTGVPHTNLGILRSYQFPAPPLPEQCAIGAALSDVDALLAGLDRLIAKKRDLKKAAVQQLLTGQTRLPGHDIKWDLNRLENVATFHKGKGVPKSALTPNGSVPCIHYGELFTQYSDTVREVFSRTNKTPGAFLSVANDVLMPTSDVTPRGLAKASCVLTSPLNLKNRL